MNPKNIQAVSNAMIKVEVDRVLNDLNTAYVECGQPAITDRERKVAWIAAIAGSSGQLKALRAMEL